MHKTTKLVKSKNGALDGCAIFANSTSTAAEKTLTLPCVSFPVYLRVPRGNDFDLNAAIKYL